MTRLPIAALLLAVAAPVLAEPVTLHLEIDPEATRALAEAGQPVTVSAWFYGPPADKWSPVDSAGLVTVRFEELTLDPVTQDVTLGENIPGIAMGWVAKPYLNVNVYAAYPLRSDAWLDCGIVDEALGLVRQHGATIACRLGTD